jgi:hypothetical protein
MWFTSLKEIIEKYLFFFTQAAQTAIDQFWSQGILGVNACQFFMLFIWVEYPSVIISS